MNKIYDLIIVGGGLVGTSLACALRNQGLRIAILEKHLPTALTTKNTDKTSGRPISLAHSSKVILDTLEIWQELAALACPIKTVHVSNQGSFGVTKIQAHDYQLPALGDVVPFAALQQSLYQHAAAQSNVDIICISDLLAIENNAEQASVTYQANHEVFEIQAPLLVAADGAYSTCRQMLDIDVTEKNDGEVALSAILELAEPHQAVAFERFTSKGTLALLPMWNRKQYRFVWTMSKTENQAVENWSAEQLLQFIQQAFSDRLGRFLSIEMTGKFPLATIIAKQQVLPSVVLLGNAAHTIYPIAAQGFNLGLRDVAVLADILVDAKQRDESIGDASQLKKYVEWREADQNRIIRMTNNISALFDLQLPLLNSARGFGLLAMEILPGFKRRLAKRSLGLAGKLPRLTRGIPLHS